MLTIFSPALLPFTRQRHKLQSQPINNPQCSKSNSSGFTIIEVLIVLAVAGIIMLIIFQAIPTLQRNARNNQRKQDIQTILQAASHWELNHSGNLPLSGDNKYLESSQTNLTYYSPNAITILTTDSGIANAMLSPVTDIEQVKLSNHAKCKADNSGRLVGAGYNDVVALYALETASGASSSQCQQI